MKADYPPPNTSILDGYIEMYRAVKRQLTDPEYYIRRQLPPGAKPYRDEFHNVLISR